MDVQSIKTWEAQTDLTPALIWATGSIIYRERSYERVSRKLRRRVFERSALHINEASQRSAPGANSISNFRSQLLRLL